MLVFTNVVNCLPLKIVFKKKVDNKIDNFVNEIVYDKVAQISFFPFRLLNRKYWLLLQKYKLPTKHINLCFVFCSLLLLYFGCYVLHDLFNFVLLG